MTENRADISSSDELLNRQLRLVSEHDQLNAKMIELADRMSELTRTTIGLTRDVLVTSINQEKNMLTFGDEEEIRDMDVEFYGKFAHVMFLASPSSVNIEHASSVLTEPQSAETMRQMLHRSVVAACSLAILLFSVVASIVSYRMGSYFTVAPFAFSALISALFFAVNKLAAKHDRHG